MVAPSVRDNDSLELFKIDLVERVFRRMGWSRVFSSRSKKVQREKGFLGVGLEWPPCPGEEAWGI